MNESIKFNESFVFNRESEVLNFKAKSSELIGELDFTIYDEFGNPIAKRKSRNKVILPGAVFVLEQLFKTKAETRNLHPTSINAGTFGTVQFASSWTEPADINDEIIFGFMVGNGGATVEGVHPVQFNGTSLVDNSKNASFIPFRIIESSLAQPTNYAMRTMSSGKYLYYAKKFDETPTIVATDSSVYVQMKLSVSDIEFREYFTDSGISQTTGVNQIGLVAGVYDAAIGSYDDVKLVTMSNFSTINLSGSSKFDVTYKLYCL